MNLKKIIMYLIVAVLVVIFSILFMRVFAFEQKSVDNEQKDIYPEVTDELIDKLYSYILNEDISERTTMYSSFYTQYQILNYDIILSMIYNYIISYEANIVETISMDDLINNNVIRSFDKEEYFVPLYKISLEDFNRVGAMLFGKKEKIPTKNFTMNKDNLRGHYIENEGYLIYQDSTDSKEADFLIKRLYNKYKITDNGGTILIYDYYVKCEKNGSTCYDDEKRKTENRIIKNIDGNISLENNLNNAQKYVHKFVYEDEYYYWFSTELAN